MRDRERLTLFSSPYLPFGETYFVNVYFDSEAFLAPFSTIRENLYGENAIPRSLTAVTVELREKVNFLKFPFFSFSLTFLSFLLFSSHFFSPYFPFFAIFFFCLLFVLTANLFPRRSIISFSFSTFWVFPQYFSVNLSCGPLGLAIALANQQALASAIANCFQNLVFPILQSCHFQVIAIANADQTHDNSTLIQSLTLIQPSLFSEALWHFNPNAHQLLYLQK